MRADWELHDTTKYLLIKVVMKNRKFVVVTAYLKLVFQVFIGI
jgi:hypothetical protein